MRKITLEQAKLQYSDRYTMEYIPTWARKPCEGTGLFYAPQYRNDKEWYDSTVFPGEKGLHGNSKHCRTTGQTWPLGKWLEKPFKV